MLIKRWLFGTLMILILNGITAAQTLPSCSQRPYQAEFPRVHPAYWCIEWPIVADSAADRTYTALHVAQDGTLYATHPYRGEVVALTDSDGDGLPDDEHVIADDLHFPNGIAAYDETLYIVGDGIIYILIRDEIEILVDDLPQGLGFLMRAIAVDDRFIYIGIPSPCDFCESDDPLRGTVLRMAHDGSNQTVIARGLRYPAALAFYQDDLWVADSARDGFSVQTFYDEINRIDLRDGTMPHFGFPYCVGYDNLPDLEADFACEDATAPIITFRSNSTPIGLHQYTADTFPDFTNRMLIVLAGSSNSRYISGHAILSVAIDETRHLYETIAPVDNATNQLPSRWQQADGREVDLLQAEFVNNQAGGLFPHLPYDITQSPEGWLYFSVQGKGVYVLRPQS